MTHLSESSESAPWDQYIHGHHESVLRSHTSRTVVNSAAYLIPELRSGDVLLDVGCGPGTITVDLARRLAPGRVVGLDASSEIVEHAAGLAADEAVDNATFQVGDVYALSFPDATFNVVHAHQVLQHLADPVAAMIEIRRVLRPGGTFAARDVDYGGVTIAPSIGGLVGWMRVYREVHYWNGGDTDAGRSLKTWARRANYTRVTSFASHTIESGVADLADLADLKRMAAAWHEWVRDPDGCFAMPHGEILVRA